MGLLKVPKRIGMLLLGIWLLVFGIPILVRALDFSGRDNVMALLAIAAGVLILMDR